jgi:hypothetical protein
MANQLKRTVEERRQRSCVGKKPYLDRAIAERDARALARRECHPFNAYRCEFCSIRGDVWHVGHTPARLRNAA